MAVGLGLGALVLGDDAPWPLIVVWAIGLFIAGCGVGVAWPHLSAWIMGAVDDPVEAGTAAAAINTVQLISGAFGAGLAGIVVNLTEGGDGPRHGGCSPCSRSWPPRAWGPRTAHRAATRVGRWMPSPPGS